MEQIDWADFLKVELRVGRIIQAEVFEQARKPAYIYMSTLAMKLALRNRVRRLLSVINLNCYWVNWWWQWLTFQTNKLVPSSLSA